MRSIRLARWFVVFVALAVVLVVPAAVQAQCMIATTVVNTTPGTIQVFKVLSAATTCSTVATNAYFCSPTFAIGTTLLLATAMTVTASPSCEWNCGCGTVTIDGSDGLPVELMEFTVEATETSGAKGGGGEGKDG